MDYSGVGSRGVLPLIFNLGTGCFPTGKEPAFPFEWEAGWAPEPACTVLGKRRISCLFEDPNPGSSNSYLVAVIR